MNSQGKPQILLVEDDPSVALTIRTILDAEGYPVEHVSSSGEALDLLADHSYPIVLSDIYLDERTGLDVLRRAKSLNPHCVVVLMTARGTFETVLEATQAGAFDYIAKPFVVPQFIRVIQNAEQAAKEVGTPSTPSHDSIQGTLIGNSAAMVEVYKFISRVADSDSTVLLQGETGTGKELVAQLIHQSSSRKNKRMAVIDCGALSPTLLEAELFGAVRGAYTGADRDREGLLESAEDGTVFLDEIGEIESAFQLRLLRFLQEREVRPVGSSVSRTVNTRVIAATNRDLRQLVAEKKFREDLWYRLHVTSLRLAPLRERLDDIPSLVEHFLQTFAAKTGRSVSLSNSAMRFAQEYRWPGNVRQLQNVLERLLILHPSAVVEEQSLRDAITALDPTQGSTSTPAESLANREEEQIRKVLEATAGNKTRAAEILGIERKTLYRKLEKMKGVSE